MQFKGSKMKPGSVRDKRDDQRFIKSDTQVMKEKEKPKP
jgi:hypothetical protein